MIPTYMLKIDFTEEERILLFGFVEWMRHKWDYDEMGQFIGFIMHCPRLKVDLNVYIAWLTQYVLDYEGIYAELRPLYASIISLTQQIYDSTEMKQ